MSGVMADFHCSRDSWLRKVYRYLMASTLAMGSTLVLSSLPLPLAIAAAVLRHGLWDVDVVVNRSLVYGVLLVGVVGVYAVVVVALGSVIGRTTGAPLLIPSPPATFG